MQSTNRLQSAIYEQIADCIIYKLIADGTIYKQIAESNLQANCIITLGLRFSAPVLKAKHRAQFPDYLHQKSANFKYFQEFFEFFLLRENVENKNER